MARQQTPVSTFYRWCSGSPPRRFTWKYPASCAVLLVAVAALLAVPASASALTWSSPVSVDPGVPLQAVSCPSATFCVAVTYPGPFTPGGASYWNGSTWSAPATIDNTGGLLTVSCSSTTFCVAFDYSGNEVNWNGTSWSAPAHVETWIPGAVSCATHLFCVEVDHAHDAVDWNGSIWSSPFFIDSNPQRFTSVSCPAEDFCAAVGENQSNGEDGDVAIWNGAHWSQTPEVDGEHDYLSAISCPAVARCYSGDDHGNVLYYDGAWHASALSTGADYIDSISCATIVLCIAADTHAHALTWNGTSWSSPATIDEHTGPISVSCVPSSSFCAAVDSSGYALTTGTETSPPAGVPGKETSSPPVQSASQTSNSQTPISSAQTSISSAQIAALLGQELTPAGKAAKIATLLKTRVFAVTFKALEAGKAVIDWYQLPPGARLAKKTRAKPILVASGEMPFSTAGTAKIKVKLTAAGKRLLKNAKDLKLTAKGTFTPVGKTPVIATRAFVLAR